ncbi:MAG TPA: hypothetical protein VM510_08750 [Caulifigura sp.]|jgi:hypothetical protein|nr:hypothetical protein [Caulifigura sp.]
MADELRVTIDSRERDWPPEQTIKRRQGQFVEMKTCGGGPSPVT